LGVHDVQDMRRNNIFINTHCAEFLFTLRFAAVLCRISQTGR
jgi:hypothetical protein